MEIPFAENYKIKMVEPIYRSTREQRVRWIAEANYNLFNLRSEQVFIDLLTDSGTGAMSDRQWAAIMTGDESYAGSSSYYHLKETIRSIFGFEYFLPTHQGRAAENVLFSALVKEGDLVPGNSHFDTTKGHIEYRKAKAIDCTVDEAFDTESKFPFKGNVDLAKLEEVLKLQPEKNIPAIIITITCNTSGGQPVSMDNMKAVKQLADKYGVPVIYDSARFAENAWFIQQKEEGFAGKTIREIVSEMFSYADAMTMSSKKDGAVNIGGFIAMKDVSWYEKASTFNIMYEGFVTYGGMAGRDMNALAVGLNEVTTNDFLDTRIKQVHYLGDQLIEYGIPVQHPIGGHAVFVDAKKFFPHVPKEEFVAQTLAIILYLEAGVRGVEVGTLLADRDPETRDNRYPKLEFLRLAIPRRTYTNNHMDVVAAGLKNIYDIRDEIRTGLRIRKEAPIMRHFTVQLDKV
ncbi:MAG: tyrosine phenol-lyase [Bacteroidetes bacterium GWF2_42_66]|nr:MAG: tyrosine phenol-lyase [Bacteroidetes bacterium GWE2_42_39]OFY42790.1 MAG: tyrosine phenol-lyase [Bacteroidetes bacterium GWF2_42_66]HBL74410.1 tyrosine phenol-lyase [Prolixibacteraceae bacterium]HCU61892.1 tyrosine phenol-lyase [Prolixibacteraceae bacterium]